MQPVLAAEGCALPSATTARNVADTQQLATGESSTAAEEHSLSLDDHQHQEEDDPDADDNKQLHFDAEISCITGFDMHHDDGADEYHQKWICYISKKEALMGASITKGQGLNAVTWTVCSDVSEAKIPANINNEFENVGVKQIDFQSATTISFSGAHEHTNLLLLLIHLWPGDWHLQISPINGIIDKRNDENAAKI